MRVYKLSGGWMERWRRRKRIESREWRFSFFSFSFCLLTSTSPIISLVETVVSIRRMLPWWMSTSNLTHWNRLKRNTIGIGAMPAKMMTTAIANTQPGYAVGTAMPWKQRKGKKKRKEEMSRSWRRYFGNEIYGSRDNIFRYSPVTHPTRNIEAFSQPWRLYWRQGCRPWLWEREIAKWIANTPLVCTPSSPLYLSWIWERKGFGFNSFRLFERKWDSISIVLFVAVNKDDGNHFHERDHHETDGTRETVEHLQPIFSGSGTEY